MRRSTPRHRSSPAIHCGDLIAVRCNPLEDVACLQRVEVVVKGGLLSKDDRAAD